MLTACRERKCQGFSRKFLPLPNLWIKEWCEEEAIAGLDGEIMLPYGGFNDVQSFAMSELTLPKPWQYNVFDYHYDASNKQSTYLQRLQKLKNLIGMFGDGGRVKLILPIVCKTAREVAITYQACIDEGHEGIIIRNDSPYKQGRATRNEQSMLKMKQFQDAEAIIIGFEPEYENLNEQTKDETGQAKRSSHQANKKAKETLGRFLVRDKLGRAFYVGASITKVEKKEIWENRSRYMGLTLTYKFSPHGMKPGGLPRHPIFKGIRRD